MKQFQQKKRIRRILYSPIVLLILAIITVLLIRGCFGVYNKQKTSEANLERERMELQKLATRENSLSSSLNYLKTDQGVENEIRSKFRAVREGEKVAVIIDDQPTTSYSTTTQEHGFWYNLFH